MVNKIGYKKKRNASCTKVFYKLKHEDFLDRKLKKKINTHYLTIRNKTPIRSVIPKTFDFENVIAKIISKINELSHPSPKGEGKRVRSNFTRETDTMPGYAGSSW